MIFIDSNIFIYAAGREHPHKRSSVDFLRQVATGDLDGVISVEILQEILHRYRSINRWTDGETVYRSAISIVPEIVGFDTRILNEAVDILNRHEGLAARDALHAATCHALNVEFICSFDADFDAVEDLRRMEPGDLLELKRRS